MLSAGRTYITSFWWMTFFPGVFIVLSAAADDARSAAACSSG